MKNISTKEKVLSLLELGNGSPISGSDIASKLNISRNSVWKAVNSLKNDGYEIVGVNKMGYTLNVQSNVLSSSAILNKINNKDFIKKVVIKETTASTNDDAKLLGHNGETDGTLVLAKQQTAGKGRRGKSFFSPPSSGIYMSLLLSARFEMEHSLLITTAAAVAVCRAIKKLYNVDCEIKWVNDVYINGKKLVGILTEASMDFENQSLEYVVVGIGINITKQSFPEEISDIATSLCEHTKLFISHNELIAAIVNELETIILTDLETCNFIEEYKKLSFILGSEIDIIYVDRKEEATAIDINNKGHLIVKKENGDIITLSSGDVSIRKKK